MNKLIGILFSLAIVVLINPTYGASFDCTKAKTPLEKTICSNDNISKLDDEMSIK